MNFDARQWLRDAATRWSRRDVFTMSAVTGLLGLASKADARQTLYENSIYTRLLGVRPLLTCRGHTTAFGGSLMPEEVLRAMVEANDVFVDMTELHDAAGRRIAQIMKTEAAMISAGSFSAMLLGAAACLSGRDQARIEALPHPTWERRECVIQKAHRVGYDRAYRAAGATIVEVETKEQFRNAIGPKTAMLAALASTEHRPRPEVLTLKEYVELGKKAGVPVIIDAASELPPSGNLTRFTATGADLVVISGGKGILGPQSTGLLGGRKDLIEAARLHASPNANIGRGMKVGKEEMIGLIVALERYVNLDHDAVIETWNKKARYLADQLQGIPGFQATYRINAYGFGEVRMDWDRKVIRLDGFEAAAKLMAGNPRISYYEDEDGGILQTRCMKDGDEIFAARRLRGFFTEAGRAKA